MDSMNELRRIATTIKNPVFHAGYIDDNKATFGDSFGAVSLRQISDSLGSGLYVTSNVQDVIEWSNHTSSGCDIYLFDLDDAENLMQFTSDDELDDYTDFLGSLTKFTLRDLEFTHYTQKPFFIADETFDAKNELFCNKYGLDTNEVKSWAMQMRKNCVTMLDSDNLHEKESIATLFQKQMLGINGIDASRTIMCDSVSLGSLIFDSKAIKPVYNFGQDNELAREFYKIVHEKIVDRKLENIPLYDKEAISDIARWGYDSINPSFKIEKYEEMLMHRQKQITLKNVMEIINAHSSETVIKNMENKWDAYFTMDKDKRDGIMWQNQKLRPAAFDEMYLLQCERQHIKPREDIKAHFFKNCVEIQGFKPTYLSSQEHQR